MAKKVARRRRWWLPNPVIMVFKLLSALGMFFACCLFTMMHPDVIKRDLGLDSSAPLGSADNPWWNILFLIGFFLGISFIIYYITNLIIHIETKELWKADQLFVAYQIVFIAIIVITIWRWFFVDVTNARVPSIIMVVAGIINLITPKIIDNNNSDF